MPINKLLMQEESNFLIELYKNKKNLDLYLTSGSYYCYDTNIERNFINDNNIKIIKSALEKNNINNFNHIYLDSNYISSKDASLFKHPIIKI